MATPKRIFTKEEIADVLELYDQGYSRYRISKMLYPKYHLSKDRITRLLQEQGRELINYNDSDHRPFIRNMYNLDKHYFDSIDCPEKAYYIGFLMADGSNSIEHNIVSLTLQERDIYILERMKSDMHSTIPLYKNTSKCNLDNYQKDFTTVTYKMHSKHICERLDEIGVSPRKSYTAEFSSHIPYEYYRDFLRGYIDGDGWISWNPWGSKQCIVGMCGASRTFLDQAKMYCAEELGVTSHIYSRKGNDVLQLMITRRMGVYKFLTHIYKDATVYLPRKYEKYLQVCKDIKLMDISLLSA